MKNILKNHKQSILASVIVVGMALSPIADASAIRNTPTKEGYKNYAVWLVACFSDPGSSHSCQVPCTNGNTLCYTYEPPKSK